jgi:hypothetical protein
MLTIGAIVILIWKTSTGLSDHSYLLRQWADEQGCSFYSTDMHWR